MISVEVILQYVLYLLAVVRKVDAKIHEIVLAKGRGVHNAFEEGLIHLVGNVSQHDLEVGQT
jgi:hypothetical protein